jgi:hypothetical protein
LFNDRCGNLLAEVSQQAEFVLATQNQVMSRMHKTPQRLPSRTQISSDGVRTMDDLWKKTALFREAMKKILPQKNSIAPFFPSNFIY